MVQTLLKIELDAMALEQLIFESGGEIVPEIEAWMEEIEKNLELKADAYCAVMKRFDSTAALMKEKANTYDRAAKALLNAKERLRDNVKNTMMKLGKEEILGDNIRFKLQIGAPKLVIDNENEIPELYKIVETTVSLDKDKIKNMLKGSEKVPGAHLESVAVLRDYVRK